MRDVYKFWDRPSRVGNCDGLEVNSVTENRKVSRFTARFSPYSTDNYHIKKNGDFHALGIQVKARKANSDRGLYQNFYCDKMKGR